MILALFGVVLVDTQSGEALRVLRLPKAPDVVPLGFALHCGYELLDLRGEKSSARDGLLDFQSKDPSPGALLDLHDEDPSIDDGLLDP
ncbi:hypothetical protein E2C01_016118 [Portunus trituberculatus]|uniref:Uncharacterized protein n=1 Tax=Portunus trituberculatus TaxID=210409 RepID=A0A5B7DNK5_PORTR|nr:hypothetical protein [Portunus trituberculatus]